MLTARLEQDWVSIISSSVEASLYNEGEIGFEIGIWGCSGILDFLIFQVFALESPLSTLVLLVDCVEALPTYAICSWFTEEWEGTCNLKLLEHQKIFPAQV